jgi:hypothetical protein
MLHYGRRPTPQRKTTTTTNGSPQSHLILVERQIGLLVGFIPDAVHINTHGVGMTMSQYRIDIYLYKKKERQRERE